MALGDTVLGDAPVGAGVIVNLTVTSTHGKYGVVTVLNANGSFNREFKITAAELATLQASVNGIPPGVTQTEWESGRAVVSGKDFEVGDMRLRANGKLFIKYAEKVVNGRFVESFFVLSPGEFSGTPPKVTITASALASLNDRPSVKDVVSGATLTRSPVLSLVDGVLESA